MIQREIISATYGCADRVHLHVGIVRPTVVHDRGFGFEQRVVAASSVVDRRAPGDALRRAGDRCRPETAGRLDIDTLVDDIVAVLDDSQWTGHSGVSSAARFLRRPRACRPG